MMTDRHDHIREAAIDWAIRLNDADFDDWDGFASWLEADPAHAPAYDAVVAATDAAEMVLRAAPAPRPATAPPPRPARRWRPMAGGLIAAAIVGAIGWSTLGIRAAPYALETRHGERRTIAIGTATIALNGDTRLVLDRADPHRATLDRGEALFDVRHDAEHPFTVHVGGAEVRDIGTRFDLTRDAGATRVAVAEGTVLYNPRAEAVRLDAGHVLTAPDGKPELRIARAAADDIGSWREDRLSYEQAPIATVAADLTRGIGVRIDAAPAVAAQRFTGVIAYAGPRDRVIAGLGPLLDVEVKHGHDGWLLIPKAGPRH